jgi:transcriptional regulator with GAF, ATPase, and Fis domain
VHPPQLRRAIELSSQPVSIGREQADVSLPLSSLSRRHLVISWSAAAEQHVVEDVGSRHGTSLNGTPLSGPAALTPQAVIRAADLLLVYESGGPEADETRALPGRSGAAHRLRAEVAAAASDAAPVLILGATGVGKESVAAELHRLSGRRGPLLAVNCAALSPQLAESQLFGHVKGAFTGADAATPGLFRAASGGTLFLDEVGELSAELQPKLLRALQQREVLPVGATQPVKVDVRVVAATNRDLAEAIERGTFRRDLHARLALWEIRVPLLKDRRADILEWVERLRARWEAERGSSLGRLELEAEAAEALLLAPLPENLRTLDRLVHLLGVRREPVTVEDLPLSLLEAALPAPGGASGSGDRADQRPSPRRASPSKEELAATLTRLGSVRATARHYERDRRQIYRWIDAFGLDWKDADDRDA